MRCISRELSQGSDIAPSVQSLVSRKISTHDVKGGYKLDDSGEVRVGVDLDGGESGEGRVHLGDDVVAVLGRIRSAIWKIRVVVM